MSDLSQLQIESMRERVSQEEWQTRVNLAACYRLTNTRYKPGQRRRIGELEWAGLLRLLERRYPGFRD